MARDRKRAKQRRERAARGAGAPQRPRPLPELDLPESKPVRTEIPGSLEHASGVEDEFEAALVRGADGVPLPAEQEAELEAEEEEAAEDLLEEAAPAAGGGRSDGGGRGQAHALAERPSGAPIRGGNRVIGFLRASWAELQRVQWPDRRQVTQGTAVVIGFVAVAGIYLGVADFVAKEIVEYIL